jgi:hypothetical protein
LLPSAGICGMDCRPLRGNGENAMAVDRACRTAPLAAGQPPHTRRSGRTREPANNLRPHWWPAGAVPTALPSSPGTWCAEEGEHAPSAARSARVRRRRFCSMESCPFARANHRRPRAVAVRQASAGKVTLCPALCVSASGTWRWGVHFPPGIVAERTGGRLLFDVSRFNQVSPSETEPGDPAHRARWGVGTAPLRVPLDEIPPKGGPACSLWGLPPLPPHGGSCGPMGCAEWSVMCTQPSLPARGRRRAVRSKRS